MTDIPTSAGQERLRAFQEQQQADETAAREAIARVFKAEYSEAEIACFKVGYMTALKDVRHGRGVFTELES